MNVKIHVAMYMYGINLTLLALLALKSSDQVTKLNVCCENEVI